MKSHETGCRINGHLEYLLGRSGCDLLNVHPAGF